MCQSYNNSKKLPKPHVRNQSIKSILTKHKMQLESAQSSYLPAIDEKCSIETSSPANFSVLDSVRSNMKRMERRTQSNLENYEALASS